MHYNSLLPECSLVVCCNVFCDVLQKWPSRAWKDAFPRCTMCMCRGALSVQLLLPTYVHTYMRTYVCMYVCMYVRMVYWCESPRQSLPIAYSSDTQRSVQCTYILYICRQAAIPYMRCHDKLGLPAGLATAKRLHCIIEMKHVHLTFSWSKVTCTV